MAGHQSRVKGAVGSAAAVGGALVLAVTLVACGGSTKAATSSPASAASSSKGFAAFTSCLESHGVPKSAIPSRPNRPPGSPPSSHPSTPPSSRGGYGGGRFGQLSSKYSAAFQACRSELPNGFGQGGGAQNAAYRNCLKLHGVNLPSGPQGSGSTSTSTTVSQSVLQQARQACASLRSPPTSGGSTPTST